MRVLDDAIRVYEQYIEVYPRPLDLAMQTRDRLSEIYHQRSDYQRYFDMLNEIVEEDGKAGPDRTDRSRFLASKAALVLVERQYEQFARMQLNQPFEESLAAKQESMDVTLAALDGLFARAVLPADWRTLAGLSVS